MQALGVVLRQTWPRVPAHAQTLWDHLVEEHKAAESSNVLPPQPAEEHDSSGMSEQQCSSEIGKDAEKNTGIPNMQHMGASETKKELRKAIVEVAEVLWWAGGEAFREQVQHASSEVSGRLLQEVTCIHTMRSSGLQATEPDC